MPLGEELRFVERTKVDHGGRRWLFFGGTDYHRLSSHPEVVAALGAAALEEGLSCAGSRITTGNHPLLTRLEERISEFLGGGLEAAVCAGGYLANTVLLETVGRDFQRFFLDAGAHVSVAAATEGLARTRVHRFRAGDPEDLARSLARRARPGERPLVLTDGVGSGNGALPPLAAYWETVRAYGGQLLVDDSHGLAVLGASGRGSPEEAGLPAEAYFHSGTLSKGFGCFGGLAAGPAGFRLRVAERSRAYIGATPVPPPLAAAALRALELVRAHPEWISGLRRRALAFRARLAALGLPEPDSPAPIFSVAGGDEPRRRRLGALLREAGIYPSFINYPGSPAGGHFRFALSSVHADAEVELLAQVLERSLR
jgi:7-keto-8-aminopelargonate synthetase-like enzyme